MVRWKFGSAGVVAFVLVGSLLTGPWGWASQVGGGGAAQPATGVGAGAAQPATGAGAGAAHPATGVGSCTLKNWNPNTDPNDAKDLPVGDRTQTCKPDDYNCTGATFAAPGSEFTKFPQPHDFNVNNKTTTRTLPVCQSL